MTKTFNSEDFTPLHCHATFGISNNFIFTIDCIYKATVRNGFDKSTKSLNILASLVKLYSFCKLQNSTYFKKPI